MSVGGILDRYILREWAKVFFVTTLGFPLVVIAIDATDHMDEYLARGLTTKAIVVSYVYSLPEKAFMVLPAAVLFATVFTIGAMGRHSELTAAKASGRSFHRIVFPLFIAGAFAALLGLGLGEVAPPATRRQLEYLGERRFNTVTSRFNFVFRADRGWVYTIRSLDLAESSARDVVMEREGLGEDYPTLVIQTFAMSYKDSLRRWTVGDGRMRIVSGNGPELVFAYDSMYIRGLVETPQALLAEPKAPEEMRYRELGEYIDAIVRSGGDARKLEVDRALKIAVPMTCLIIAIFAAPLAITGPRASAAFGVAISLATTIFFLTLIQLSRAIGSGGIVPPVLAAWMPNILFGGVGLWLMRRAPT